MSLRDKARWSTNWVIDRFFIKQPRLRLAVTRALETGDDRQIELCGTPLTVNSVKEHGYLRAWRMADRSAIFRDELSVALNLAFLLRDGDTFVDVGANVGFYARTVARFARLAPALQVYAFEANPDTFTRLVAGGPSNVIAEQVALSNRSGTLEFEDKGMSGVFSVAGPAATPGTRRVIVRTRRLDECRLEGDSLVVKIDVEGHEKQVVEGMEGLFDARRVRAVYVDGFSDPSLPEHLSARGFRLFDGRTLLPMEGAGYALLAIRA